MAGSIREKQKKVREQGYKAAKEDKIFPRELQNTTNGSWEDAKLYSMKTRQGQTYWQGHMKDMSQIQRPKQTRNSDVQRGNRAKAPTPPTPSPVPKRSTTEKRVNNTINREKGNIRLTKQSNRETVRKYEDAFKNRKRGK